MMSFKTEHPYVPEIVTDRDLKVATLAFGFVIGFIIPCCNTAWKQSHKLSAYTIMIWGEITVCWIFAVICWLYLIDVIPHSFAFFFSILTCWALQVQFLLQIIIKSVSTSFLLVLLSSDRRRQNWLKYGVAAIITAINISVYCIWIPARLQINHRYEEINIWWDRCEKCIYLVIDAALNIYFIQQVNKRLIAQGLERYRPLVSYNRNLIVVSMACDVMIIGLMSLPNSFVYMSFHSVGYLIKLAIEMALGDLIITISSAKPARDTVNAAFEGLKIAVSTHTTTTAVRFDDGDAGDDVDGLRKTRTPARPDLSIRLEKIRRDRKARKAAEVDELGLGRDEKDNFDDDIKIDMEAPDSAHWENSVHHLPIHGTYSPSQGSFLDEKL
ncbi:uncharacterized protein JCM15063_003062 [Sporobolomyces koalae]|uniref:uncharacterized protein n=1 Tax=Sporobolomyces koalae TaxID=500713 RepID=UPI003176AE0B